MESEVIKQLLHHTAEQIRKETKLDAKLWSAVPLRALEANGTLGWNEAYSLTYVHGLYPVSKGWPSKVYVECQTGRLVVSGAVISDASDDEVVRAYIDAPEMLDVTSLLVKLKDIANRPHTSDAARVSETREDHRRRYNVTERWDRPATPIKWHVGGR